jgi:hypothetical protein
VTRIAAAVVLCLALAGASPPASAAPGQRRIVAVFEIEARGAGLPAASLQRLTDYLAAGLAGGGYQVIPRSTVQRRLREKKLASYKACHDQSCQVEIGRELAAQAAVSTKILRLGSLCAVTSTIYDLKLAASTRAGRARARCAEEALLEALDSIARQLAPPPPPASKPAPPPPPARPLLALAPSGGKSLTPEARALVAELATRLQRYRGFAIATPASRPDPKSVTHRALVEVGEFQIVVRLRRVHHYREGVLAATLTVSDAKGRALLTSRARAQRAPRRRHSSDQGLSAQLVQDCVQQWVAAFDAQRVERAIADRR